MLVFWHQRQGCDPVDFNRSVDYSENNTKRVSLPRNLHLVGAVVLTGSYCSLEQTAASYSVRREAAHIVGVQGICILFVEHIVFRLEVLL